MVEREPDWLPEDISGLAGLDAYREKVCPGCGFHHAALNELGLRMSWEDIYCPGCKAIAQYDRARTAADERLTKQLGKDPAPLTPRPGDGRHTHIRLTPREGASDPEGR